MDVTVTVTGLDTLKILDPAKAREAMKRGMKRAVTAGANNVKINSPVDTGRLRASVTSDVQDAGSEVVGVVGSNVSYAPFMEYGTGALSDGGGGGGGHSPPSAALEGWAARHGIPSGFLVARAIARAGGLRPRRMFRKVLESDFFDTIVTTNIQNELRKVFGI